MSEKYGKKIVAETTIELKGNEYTCYVLDDNEYYNIHIVDDKFQDFETNTLKLQEPKDVADLSILISKPYMLCQIMEHFLWDICYGIDNKVYSFNVEIDDISELTDK